MILEVLVLHDLQDLAVLAV